MLLHKIDNTITEFVREYFSKINLSRNIQSFSIFVFENFNEQNDEIFVNDDININFSILKKCLKFELHDQNKKRMKNIDKNNQNNV